MARYAVRKLVHTAFVAFGVKRKELYTEATRIVHEDKPWLELFQEVIIYGVSKRIAFKPRADHRLIVSEMTVSPR